MSSIADIKSISIKSVAGNVPDFSCASKNGLIGAEIGCHMGLQSTQYFILGVKCDGLTSRKEVPRYFD